MNLKTRYQLVYGYLWVRLIVVLAFIGGFLWGGWLDDEFLEFIDASLQTDFHAAWRETNPWLVQTIKIFLLVLLCWRMVKVFVFQGSPLPCGLQVVSGRQDNGGTSGRWTSQCFIGDWDVHRTDHKVETNGFWFGAIFRAHPTSDKLARSRLQLLLLALPFGWTLQVNESRIFIQQLGHENRATSFRMWTDRYLVSKTQKSGRKNS